MLPYLATHISHHQHPPPMVHRLHLMNLPGHFRVTRSPWFPFGSTFSVAHSVSLEKCVVTCVHHSSLIRYFQDPEDALCSAYPPSLRHSLATMLFLPSPWCGLCWNVTESRSHSVRVAFRIGVFCS